MMEARRTPDVITDFWQCTREARGASAVRLVATRSIVVKRHSGEASGIDSAIGSRFTAGTALCAQGAIEATFSLGHCRASRGGQPMPALRSASIWLVPQTPCLTETELPTDWSAHLCLLGRAN